ncbi:MAG: hypothetical protein QOC82_672 [Frankiaceae bacterium]|jgi:hypothetical protein|nr:hypothetical protein [Frankiaceae bacterium]
MNPPASTHNVTVDGDTEARARREAAAAEFRPGHISTLLVAEAPPSALDRYFYFLDVDVQDSLFRHVIEATFGEKPTRDKRPWLDALKNAGYFLLDLSPDPFDDPSVLRPLVPTLVTRCARLRPERIVLIGARVYDLAYGALHAAQLPVVDVRLPIPGYGQRQRFLDLATPVLATNRAPSR